MKYFNKFILALCVSFAVAACTGGKAVELQTLTIQEDFASEKLASLNEKLAAAGMEDFSPATYTIDFSKKIPVNYKDKIVLENLRAAYSKHIVNSDEISSEIAVADYIEELKQLYGETIDEDLAYCMEDSEDDFDLANFLMHFHWYSNNIDTVYINNGRLIQFFSYSSDYMGGAHGAVGYKSLLYDLKEDRVVPLNDVFDRDEDEKITELLCQEFVDEWCDYDEEDVIISQIREYIWKDDTDFAVAEEGIYFNYSSYALGVYAFGSPSMLITYDRLDGMLRPDTPVYDLYLKAVGK